MILRRLRMYRDTFIISLFEMLGGKKHTTPNAWSRKRHTYGIECDFDPDPGGRRGCKKKMRCSYPMQGYNASSPDNVEANHGRRNAR